MHAGEIYAPGIVSAGERIHGRQGVHRLLIHGTAIENPCDLPIPANHRGNAVGNGHAAGQGLLGRTPTSARPPGYTVRVLDTKGRVTTIPARSNLQWDHAQPAPW